MWYQKLLRKTLVLYSLYCDCKIFCNFVCSIVTLSRDKHDVGLLCKTCFHNVINFHDTGVIVILFTPKQTQGFHWFFCLKFPILNTSV